MPKQKTPRVSLKSGLTQLSQDSGWCVTRKPHYHVHWFKDGKTSLEALAAKSHRLHGQVILLEDNLPGLNGLEILKHLKKDKIIHRSKVVWLSTATNEVEKALSLGYFDYINIPCNISAFMYRLRNFVEG